VFKVPPLRNVAMTAPYFHDGAVATLPEAVRIMARVQLGRTLADPDVRDLVAFLESLTGPLPEDFATIPALPAAGGGRGARPGHPLAAAGGVAGPSGLGDQLGALRPAVAGRVAEERPGGAQVVERPLQRPAGGEHHREPEVGRRLHGAGEAAAGVARAQVH